MSGPTQTYTKDDWKVEWYEDKCIHCTRCVTELPEVFNLQARPWVNLDGATKERIEQQVVDCPSGALTMYKTCHEEHP